MERAERDRNDVLIELERACTRASEEQERQYAAIEELTRQWKRTEGDCHARTAEVRNGAAVLRAVTGCTLNCALPLYLS